MKIVFNAFPPNYDEIQEKFHPSMDTVFTYAPCVYSPDGRLLPVHLVEHEKVHLEQQGIAPELWWRKYLEEKEFRLSQELPAFRAQYKYMKKSIKDKNQLYYELRRLSSFLSSEKYGSMISRSEAETQISC